MKDTCTTCDGTGLLEPLEGPGTRPLRNCPDCKGMAYVDLHSDRIPQHRDVWAYKDNNDQYTVHDVLKVKIGKGEWVDGVVYGRNGLTFCRDLETFLEKFRWLSSRGGYGSY